MSTDDPRAPGRTLEAQLGTARYLLAQFITQLDEYDAHMRLGKRGRRLAINRGTFDPTIIERHDVLVVGRVTWEERVAELLDEIAERDAS